MGNASTPRPEIDAKAWEVITRMTGFVTSAEKFSMTLNLGNEATLRNGQRVELGSNISVSLARPDRARVRIENRDGDTSIIVLDGKTLSVLGKTKLAHTYDQTDQPGDIDLSFKYLNTVLGTDDQIRDFFSIELTDRLTRMIESGLYLGESRIDGKLCDNLALRSEDLDVQIWVSKSGDPLPCRIFVTHSRIEGQPYFWADFVDWDFSPEFTNKLFEFKPPDDAVRFQFFAPD